MIYIAVQGNCRKSSYIVPGSKMIHNAVVFLATLRKKKMWYFDSFHNKSVARETAGDSENTEQQRQYKHHFQKLDQQSRIQ